MANNLKEAEKALDEAKKKTPTATGSAAARIAEKQRIEAGIMEAQGVVDYWNTVKAMHDKAVAETPSETVVPEAETTDLEIVNDGNGGVDEQGNVLNSDGSVFTVKVNTIDEITDDDFDNPNRSIELPQVPDNVANAIGTNGRPVIIKKNIFGKNGETHVDLDPSDSREILSSALYNPNLVGQTQPKKRPDYKVAIRTGDKNSVVVLDIFEDKKQVDIVGWRRVNEKGLEKMKKQAEREGGQFLILSPEDGSAAALSALPQDLRTETSTVSEGKDNTISENVKGNDQENLPPTEETPVEPTPPTEPVSPSQMSDEVKQQTEQTPTAEQTDFVKKATSISGVTRFEETDKGLKVGDKQTWYEFDFADYDGHPEQLASDKQELEFLRGRHEENEYLSKLNPKSKEGYKYAEEHGLDPKRHKTSWWQGRLNSMIANAKKELKKEALLDVVTSYFDQRAAGLQGLQNNSAPVRAKSLDERKKTTLEDPKRKILKKIGEPRTAEEAILLDIANGTRFKWGKPATSTEDGERGLGEYWRWSPGELQSRKNLIDEDNGITPEKYSEAIETGEYFDQETNSLFAGVSDIEGFVSDIITRVHSADDALDQLVQARQALIDSEIEREQEMAKANQDMEAQAQGFEDWDDYKTYQESLSDVQVSNEDYYEISAKFAEQYQEEYERQQRARESESETDSGVDQPDEQQGVHGEGEGGDNLLQAEQAPDAGTNQRPGQSENSPASNPSDGASQRADGEGTAEIRAEIDKLKESRKNLAKQIADLEKRFNKANGLFGDTEQGATESNGTIQFEEEGENDPNKVDPQLIQTAISGYKNKIRKIDDEIAKLEASLKRVGDVTQTEIGEGEIESSTPKPRTTAKIGNQKIDDVGEKIGGARKDLAQKLSGKINLEAGTFPKMFPKFDLKKLVEQGLDPKLASTVQFLRQAAQEEYKSKLKRRTKENALAGAKFFAAYAKQVLENADTNVDFTDSGWAFTNYGKAFVITNIALYDKIHEMMGDDMFDIDLTGYEIQPVNVDGKLNYTAYRRTENGEEEKFTPYYEAKANGGTTFFKKDELDKAIDYMLGKIEKGVSYAKSHPYKISVYYNKDGYFVGVNIGGKVIPLTEKKGRDETLSYFNEHNAELQAEAARVDQQRKEEKKTERPVAKIEQIYADKSQGFRGGYVFAVKLGKEYARIMDQVFPLKDIYKYLSEHKDELQEKAQQMLDQYLDDVEKSKGWKPQLNLGGGRTRVGEDYRKGRDIGADEFRDAFGFRGVEFGNYVTQKERQRFINEAYDALMDLADLIGVSPKALSLGGQLGFAIGARGGGGKNAAHYEPELNVINLTKTQGAGSLAHEWWHALDYYFNRDGDKRKKSATAVTEAGDFSEGVRKEMRNAFLDLMERINGSEYYERSKALERKLHPGTIGTGYFDKPTELGARAFQDYVMRRLTDRGQVNDFLSSFTPEEQWNGEAKNYPYPTGKDADAIDERFDKLFGAMEQREENGNVILYHKGENDVELTKEEVELRDQVVGFMKDFLGEDSVITDWEEGQRVLDEANGRSENGEQNPEEVIRYNEGNMNITDKVKFFRTPNGEAYGFTVGGKIYVDPSIATAETPIHEYMHLWIDGVERANPKGWNDIKEKLLGEKETLNLIKSLYPDIKDENDLLKEVFSKYSGKKGAERMRADQKRLIDEADGMVGASRVAALFQRIKEALRKFWSLARDLFAGKNVNLKDKSLDDIADMAMNDFVNRFDPRMVKGKGDVFVSNAARTVEGIKQEKATPEQWLKMIEKQGGLKAGEDKWLGLSQWLKESDAKTLTKQEVLDFINENAIRIEEVNYSEAPTSQTEERESLLVEEVPEPMRERMGKLNDEYKKLVAEERKKGQDVWNARFDAFRTIAEKYGNNFSNVFGIHGGELSVRNGGELKQAAKILGVEIEETINPTRLKYTTEGLKNKREIALTVPTIEPWNESDEIHFGDAGEGRAVAWIRFGETTDADGNRVLVIDEIQSKRHQEGREKGYKKGTKEDVRKANEATIDAQIHYDTYISDLAEKYNCDRADVYAHATDAEIEEAEARMDAVSATMRAYEQVYEEANGVPQAPFEKNWMELAMKRMLRLAAEEGYDKVAWTTGEQQASRYDLSKSIDRLDVYKQGNGLYTVTADHSGQGQLFSKSDVKESELSELIGKELAEKAIHDLSYDFINHIVYRDTDLKVGGEGMKGFYDKMIPSFMNKYGKQWGVKVGEVTMPQLEEGYQTMHSVDVTPEMRQSVMQGQPMFNRVEKVADKQLSLFLQNNSDEYETQDGEKVEFTSLKDYGDQVQAGRATDADGGTGPDGLQREGDTQSPTAYRLRKLEKGETCHVERRYTEFKQFDFTGSEKIESIDDVAYIFKKLEDEAIENSFIVLVKDGVPTIIHTGIGSYTQTIVSCELLSFIVSLLFENSGLHFLSIVLRVVNCFHLSYLCSLKTAHGYYNSRPSLL